MLLHVSDADFETYTAEAKAYREHLQVLKESATLPAVTKDGKEILLFGNVARRKMHPMPAI